MAVKASFTPVRYRLFALMNCSLLLILRIAALFSKESDFAGSKTQDSGEFLMLAEDFSKSFALTSSSQPSLSFRRTPVYPFFLHLMNATDNPFAMLVLQQLLVLLIGVSIWIIARTLFSEKVAWISLILVLVEPSLLTSSYMLLSEVVFTFFFVVGVMLYVKARVSSKSIFLLILSGVFFSFAALTRPIGIVIFLVLLIEIILTWINSEINNSLRLVIVPAILLLTTLVWSLRNLKVVGVFDVSSIQSHNLHLFEGSGSLAYATDSSLESVHQSETSLLLEKIGSNHTLEQETSYRVRRGIYLIATNFPSFIKMHLIGTYKLLFGPSQGEFISFVSNAQRTRQGNLIELFSIVVFASIAIFIVVFAYLGLASSRTLHLRIILILIFCMIGTSSGIQAYARFRTPIAPMLCLLAAVGIRELRRKLSLRSSI